MTTLCARPFIVAAIVNAFLCSTAFAEDPLMSKEQYADYSVRYRCIEQQYHDDLDKKEQELVRLDEDFGLNDDNFDAFDELIPEYERDSDLLDRIIARARKECGQ